MIMNQVSYGKGSAGGAANEAGSLHRAGVAAVLAVHGLLDQPVSGLPGKVPGEIRLETLDATDDIVCVMNDGSSWFIQAKRNVGVDKELRSTINQWNAQRVGGEDCLVLAASALKGKLIRLQPALDRVSVDPGAILSPREESGRASLLCELEAVAPERGKFLLRHVRLLEWPVEHEDDSSFAHAAAMLDGSIVAIGSGHHAFRSLRSFFQAASAERLRTSPTDWVQALNADGLEVFADAKGVTGSRERARALALRDYRNVWTSRRDRLDLSMLLDGIPEIHIKGLAENYQVSWQQGRMHDRTASLYTTLRRNNRFIVTGLPGMGKSSAIVQMAALLAEDEAAPLPILLDLKGIGPRIHTRKDVNISLLVSQASKLGVGSDPSTLEAALKFELARGNVIFLVDGLDETLDRATITAAGLADLLPVLHEKCGFVLTTRSNALLAAQQTGLPKVELVTPAGLTESLRTLIEKMSVNKNPDQPAQWVADKVAWLERSRKQHHDIWNVPLLAMLTTYRAADGADELPNAASLLNEVIKDSVRKWEYSRKSAPPGGNDKELRPEMLIDGFAAIGHALNSRAELATDEAEDVIALEISYWGFAVPVNRELAKHILWFWDNSAGIFIDIDGQIQARSRQFAELADAFWATSKNRRSSWLATAVHTSSKRESVEIAAITDVHIAQGLLDHGENNPDAEARSRALSWISDFSRNGSVTLDDSSAHRLLKLLGCAAKRGLDFDDANEKDGALADFFESLNAAQKRADGSGWIFAYQLATFPTSLALRAHRDSIIGALNLDRPRLNLVEALTALSDSSFDGGVPLIETDVRKVREVLEIPIPPARSEQKIPGQHLTLYPPSFNPRTGTADVAVGTAARIEQFPNHMPSVLYALAKELPYGLFRAITSPLRAAGYFDPEPLGLTTVLPDFSNERLENLGKWEWLAKALASLPDNENIEDTGDQWRWKALADLIDALDYANASLPGFRRATEEHPGVIIRWIDAISTAGAIDRATIVGQARSFLRLAEQDESDSVTDLISATRLERIELEPHRISDEQALKLVPALLSHSEWISLSACALLFGQQQTQIADAIRNSTKKLTPAVRRLSTLVQCANSDRASADILKLLATNSPPRRTAAASYLRESHDPELKRYWQEAMLDDDLSVRYAAGSLEGVDPLPLYWSCRRCSSKNQIEDTECRQCGSSSKPSPQGRTYTVN